MENIVIFLCKIKKVTASYVGNLSFFFSHDFGIESLNFHNRNVRSVVKHLIKTVVMKYHELIVRIRNFSKLFYFHEKL